MKEIWKSATEHNWAFWICLFTSILLLIGACFTPPLFIVDKSIIAAVGELAGFGALGALYKGLDRGVDAKLKHNNTEISLENPNK